MADKLTASTVQTRDLAAAPLLRGARRARPVAWCGVPLPPLMLPERAPRRAFNHPAKGTSGSPARAGKSPRWPCSTWCPEKVARSIGHGLPSSIPRRRAATR